MQPGFSLLLIREYKRARVWSHASTSQGTPRIATNHKKLGTSQEDLPQGLQRQRELSDLGLLKLGDNKYISIVLSYTVDDHLLQQP